MFSTDKNIETIAELIEAVRNYIGLQTKFVKLDVIEKIVRLLCLRSRWLLHHAHPLRYVQKEMDRTPTRKVSRWSADERIVVSLNSHINTYVKNRTYRSCRTAAKHPVA